MRCQCTENQSQLALLVGQDDVADLPEVLRRAVSNCPQCRSHYQQLRQSQSALTSVADDERCVLRRSLWPRLESRLLSQQKVVRSSRYERFQRQFVPVFSMTTACLALVLVIWEAGPKQRRVFQTATTSGMRLDSPVIRVGGDAWEGGPVSPSVVPFSSRTNRQTASLNGSQYQPFESLRRGREFDSNDQLSERELFELLRYEQWRAAQQARQ